MQLGHFASAVMCVLLVFRDVCAVTWTDRTQCVHNDCLNNKKCFKRFLECRCIPEKVLKKAGHLNDADFCVWVQYLKGWTRPKCCRGYRRIVALKTSWRTHQEETLDLPLDLDDVTINERKDNTRPSESQTRKTTNILLARALNLLTQLHAESSHEEGKRNDVNDRRGLVVR